MKTPTIQLKEWQQKFVDQFVASENQRNMLVAVAGTGKTITSIIAAYEKLKAEKCDKLVIVTDRLVLREQWRYIARDNGIDLGDDVSQLKEGLNDGVSLTYQSLFDEGRLESLSEQALNGGLLLIADDVDRYQKRAISVCEELLKQNPGNQCLFISRTPIIGQPLDWTYPKFMVS